MHILRPHSRPTESETLRRKPRDLGFSTPSRRFGYTGILWKHHSTITVDAIAIIDSTPMSLRELPIPNWIQHFPHCTQPPLVIYLTPSMPERLTISDSTFDPLPPHCPTHPIYLRALGAW